MQSLIAGMTDRVRTFVEGADHVALVVRSPSADALPLLNVFDQVETASASDLFWTFTDPFTDANSYVSAVVSGFSVRHTAMQEAMTGAGMTPWPDIPPDVLVPALPPVQRLRGLAAFSRELLPVRDGGNNVWVLYPLEIADPAAYAVLIAQLLEHEFPFPWCHHLRFIVREEPAYPTLAQVLAGRPRIDWWQPDLSPATVNAALAGQVDDTTAPLEQRMGALLITAGSDLALHQPAAALEKYELLLRYHAPTGNLAMAALALNGMGEAYEKMGRTAEADAAYQAALIPASDGMPPAIPVLLNVVVNLANLRMQQERWQESEGYWDAAQQLAAAARNAPARIQALEQRGICQLRLGMLEQAEQSWDAGCVMAAQLEDAPLCEGLLARLEVLYRNTGRTTEAWGAERMLQDMRS